MKTSESIKNIADALCKMQKELKGAHKNVDNVYFKSTYADLASVWDAIREPLTNNGLSVVQNPMPSEVNQGQYEVETIVLHTSGEWIAGYTPIITKKENDPQALGSAITYARRYGLASATGVCPMDDDAEGAMNRDKKKGKSGSPPPSDSPPAAEKKKTDKTTNYEFLKQMAALKAKVGDELYYTKVRIKNYKHANDIVGRQDQEEIYNSILKAYTPTPVNLNPGEPGDTPLSKEDKERIALDDIFKNMSDDQKADITTRMGQVTTDAMKINMTLLPQLKRQMDATMKTVM